MKKIVFAIQIFGLMATIPTWLLLEVNHGTQTAPKTNMKESAVKSRDNLPGDITYSITGLPIAAMAFGKLNFVSNQKCSDASCTCQNCTCGSNCTCKDF